MHTIPPWVMIAIVAALIFGFMFFLVIPAIRNYREEDEKQKEKEDEETLF